MRAVVAVLALIAALSFVAWRQSRALEALAALEGLRGERVLADAERAGLESRAQTLESRERVASEARARFGMHTPDATEIVILSGDQL